MIRWRLPCLFHATGAPRVSSAGSGGVSCVTPAGSSGASCVSSSGSGDASYISFLRSCDAACCSSSSSSTSNCRAPLLPTGSSSSGFTSRSSLPRPLLSALSGPSIHCTTCHFAFTWKHASQGPRWPVVAIPIARIVFCVIFSLGCASTWCTSTISCAFTAITSAAPCLGLHLTSAQCPHWPVAIVIASADFAANPSAALCLGVRLTPVAETIPCGGRS